MQRREVKAVFFDLDGVLIDSYEAWFLTVNNTLLHYKLKKLTKKQFSGGFGNAIEKDSKGIYKGKDINDIKKMYGVFFRKNWAKVKIIDQTVPVLKAIKKRKLKTALISNSSREIVDFVLFKLDLKKYFDFVATMDDVKHSKPAPDSLVLAAKKLILKPSEIIFVGDTENDILAGKLAGCTTIGYKIKGDYRIIRLDSVIRFLN